MTGQEKIEVRKLKILESAARIIAEKGFQDATISEIAKAAGASEASVYDYYATKENLLFSIPSEHLRQLHESVVFHLKLIRGSVNKLHATLYMQLLYYKEHPDFAAIMMLILKHNRRFIDTEAHKEIRNYLKMMDRIVAEGVESGEFSSDITPYFIRSALIGTLEHIVINWLMRGTPKDLMDAFEPMFAIALKLVQKKTDAQTCPILGQLLESAYKK